MSTETSRLILFDVGETLLRPIPSWEHHFVDECLAAGVDVDQELVAAYFAREIGRFVQRVRATTDGQFSTSTARSRAFWTLLYEEMLETLGAGEWPSELPDEIYRRFSSFETYGWCEGAQSTLEAMLRAGHRIGVVSNWEAWLEGLLEHLGIAEQLVATVVSGAVGVEKPNPEIFKIALQQAEAEPQEAVMVGDSLDADVLPAIALGMAGVLLDRQDRHGREVAGDYLRIRSLTELPAVVEGL